jgi:hypothetical protein
MALLLRSISFIKPDERLCSIQARDPVIIGTAAYIVVVRWHMGIFEEFTEQVWRQSLDLFPTLVI